MTSTSELRPVTAAVLMVTAMAVIGFMDIYVVRIAGTISVWQFIFVRVSLSIPLVLLLSRLGFGSARVKRPRAVALRSAFIAVAMFLYFGSLAFMPIALALAGLFTSPIFVLLITAFVLRGSIGPWRILAVALGFLGILIVLGPSGTALGWALAMPVIGGVFYAAGVVATRAICAGESALALLLGIFTAQWVLSGAVLLAVTIAQVPVGEGGLAFLTRGWVWPMGDATPYVLMQVVGSVIGVGLLNRAYQLGEASHVAVFEYSIMIFGPLFGWVLLGQDVSLLQGVGIALIALAGGIIAVRSQ